MMPTPALGLADGRGAFRTWAPPPLSPPQRDATAQALSPTCSPGDTPRESAVRCGLSAIAAVNTSSPRTHYLPGINYLGPGMLLGVVSNTRAAIPAATPSYAE